MKLGLIGGTGLDQWGRSDATHEPETPFGPPSDAISEFRIGGHNLLFLPRHGRQHHLPPHEVNYRANLFALHALGVDEVIAVNAVGGISRHCPPGALVLPDQLIDYTWGRPSSFGEQKGSGVLHIEFAQPFDSGLRARLAADANDIGMAIQDRACLGVTQGPRLETAAEIRRLANDGCDLVGMTSMPEAALARELELPYVSICTVSNWAAGIGSEPITMADIEATLTDAMGRVRRLLKNRLEHA